MLISVENVSKYYGDRLVLNGINLTVEDTDRIGLVDVNGSGKTTLIRLLLGIEQPTDGAISTRGGLTVGYLAQNDGLEATNTIREEMRSVFADVLRLDAICATWAPDDGESDAAHDALGAEYAEKLERSRAATGT